MSVHALWDQKSGEEESKEEGKTEPMLQGRRQKKCGLKRHYKEMRREPDNVDEEEGNSPSQLGGKEKKHNFSWDIRLDVLAAAKDVRAGCSGCGGE